MRLPFVRYARALMAGALGGQGGWVEGIAKDIQGRVVIIAARIGRES